MDIAKKALEAAENLADKIHKAPEGYDEAKLPTLDEIGPSITCGSVLLCSGTAAESRLIEEVDRTDFSHSAMIVRLHDDPRLLLWTADTVDKMPDQIDKIADKDHPGTHLLVLEDYLGKLDELYPSPDGSKYRFAVARLSGVEIDAKKLWDTMYSYDGTPFPATKDEFMNFLKGQVGINTGMTTSFCAQMVANTYQKMGWLSTDHPPNYYNPGSFALTKKITPQLRNGAQLGAPEYFKLG